LALGDLSAVIRPFASIAVPRMAGWLFRSIVNHFICAGRRIDGSIPPDTSAQKNGTLYRLIEPFPPILVIFVYQCVSYDQDRKSYR
jgi:hypothetical protein